MAQQVVPVPARHTPLDRGSIREVAESPRRTVLTRYAIAIVVLVIAAGATLLLQDYLQRSVFLLFWPAIILAAWLAGLGPAVFVTVTSVAFVDFFLLPPLRAFSVSDPIELATLAMFLLVSSLVSYAVSEVERARQEAAAAALENARLVRELDEQGVELSQQLEESQAMQEELELSTQELIEHTAQAEAAETFSRGILESISDPFIVHDSDWRVRYINEPGIREFSAVYGGGQPIGQVFWEMWPELRATTFEYEMRRAMETRQPVTLEEFHPQRGRWSEMYCYPLADGGLASQWKDISERKRAEEASSYLSRATELLASSADYEATLSEVARLIVPHFADWCAISMADEDGVPRQLAVAHIDPEKLKWADELNKRYPPDNNATTGVPQVIRTGKPELYSEIPDELLVAGCVDDEHLRIMRELGLKSVLVVPLKTSDRAIGAITMVSAESGRRYTESDLEFANELARRAALAVENARLRTAEHEARENAEAANAAKTQFLAVMSHELRTPLNAIGGYAELLQMGLRGPVTSEQQADLERIQRSQRNLLSLINDILNYAKLEAGHVEFSNDRVPLRPVLEEIEPLITPQLRSRDLTYEYSECSNDLAALGDSEKIRQIILNLLSNAIKFTDPGGKISIKCIETDDRVTLTVSDTGVGIPPDKLATVFEPFVQVERKLSSNHQGTGLGLAISRDLARGMGGELNVQSELDAGSSFELTLRKPET